jgi:hypothetical protein
MDEMMRVLLLWQVRLQCRAALAAHAEMKRALRAHRRYPFWFAAQSFLVAAGNVSKALWGDGGKRAAARLSLRQDLQIDDTSCLRPRKMRNHWEHFDERLEEWFRSSPYPPTGCWVGFSRGDASPAADSFRSYDAATGELVFWGDRYSVKEIVHELEALNLNAKAWLGF